MRRQRHITKLLTRRLSSNSLEDIIHKRVENIAGVEIPTFEGVDFQEFHYDLFETPPWIDAAIIELRKLAELKEFQRAMIQDIREFFQLESNLGAEIVIC